MGSENAKYWLIVTQVFNLIPTVSFGPGIRNRKHRRINFLRCLPVGLVSFSGYLCSL